MKALDKVLDETTVKYFIGNEFCFFDVVENFKYDEDGKKTDVKDGIKVTIYSKERPKEFLNVKVNGTLNDLADFNIHDSISFENLTGKIWIKTSGKYNSKELSLKADGIQIFPLAK